MITVNNCVSVYQLNISKAFRRNKSIYMTDSLHVFQNPLVKVEKPDNELYKIVYHFPEASSFFNNHITLKQQTNPHTHFARSIVSLKKTIMIEINSSFFMYF